MSVKVKSEIEKLESKYTLGADYIKQINHGISGRFKEAYILKYVEYKNTINYFEVYIKSLLRFHEENHKDINLCPITERKFTTMYKNAKHSLNIYKAELANIRNHIGSFEF